MALKVLPQELSQSAERIRRFLQEARAASSLNHPNILTVYDAGETEVRVDANGPVARVHFIAAELIVGKTLRELIHADKAPLKRIVGYLAQAADGVAKAHQAGIVHRDLKPDNIMVTTDGFAKVLDFGLAKLTEMREERSIAADRTRDGLILGTVAYMSPEQAQGQPVDHRSDVFAFGAILYEAAARRQAFSGPSDPDVLHRIIHDEPVPLAGVPAELERLIIRAMAKNAEERIQSMKDLALELRDISSGFESLKVQSRRRLSRTARGRWLSIAAAVFAVAAAGIAGFMLNRRPPYEPVRFAIAPPSGGIFAAMANSASALQFAIAPKGDAIAFVATTPGGHQQIWLRDIASVDARPLEGTDGAWFPFWSPDGDAIGFFASLKLKRIDIHGGAAVILADAPAGRGGTWSGEGIILFSRDGTGPLYRIPAAGGDVTPALALDGSRGERSQRWPSFLPDGKRFVYLSLSGDQVPRAIYTGSLGSSAVQRIVQSDGNAELAGPDELLFVRKGSLFSQRLDRRTLRAVGEAEMVERGIGFAPSILYGSFSASQRDMIAYARWTNPNRTLNWVDRTGRVLKTVSEPADWGASFIALRGSHALLNRAEPDVGTLDLWDIDLTRGVASRITTEDSDDNQGIFSPDGTSLAFTSNRAGAFDLYLRKAGERSDKRLVTAQGVITLTDWTHDGRYIVYSDRGVTTGGDIWILPFAEGKPARPFLRTPFYELLATVSPDGRWIAYQSNQTGEEEIYVQPFPNGGKPYRVSLAGGNVPVWSADGRELFFITHKNEIAAAGVKGDAAAPELTIPTVLFRMPGLMPVQPFHPWYAAAPDGRFLMVVTPTDNPPASITVSMNWSERLRNPN
ncbi:MAG: hypothetical protein DMD33_19365 [Gemmatimonadetes bacterium]|nr:MAG: hypothetical protein DMD33_19365 [Gemmatimonadota bacterium]